MKLCTGCDRMLNKKHFHEQAKNKDGLRSLCKECYNNQCEIYRNRDSTKRSRQASKELRKAYRLKSNYGVTLEQYKEMLEAQDHRCMICNCHESVVTKYGTIRDLAIDHCHKTGKVRGLLCMACNQAIGGFKDNTEIIKKAIDYLNKYKRDV